MGILGQNRKPDKVCPGNFFAQKLRNWIISLMPHNFSHFIESIKRYLEKGALKSQQQQQLSLVIDLAKISLRDQKSFQTLQNQYKFSMNFYRIMKN